ncbi:L-serine ammonia-lyase [Coxiella endosymbiont of Ornithodoros amblus]|uniref:L-serine ammonia-lyase n=1 Tax=Coxiella endosymbiont of Ornithodoros amblus TaxID=1656166 RepID=UPI00244DB38A|nr:L-serine ammonia-lyase [Coxiella endosymbiont of Ornithodoros amblus]MBW5802348.1 L-serine ammonia-lyase [Coxiella endosymbiont of Ornithodoros amblus]
MISVFDLFSIGIGPSSSHTVGPMRAANEFVRGLVDRISDIDRLTITLYGSLAFTGKGHGTDKAVVIGLIGESPETVNPDSIEDRIRNVETGGQVALLNQYPLNFSLADDIIFNYQETFDFHSNAVEFRAYSKNAALIQKSLYFSVGGGFIVNDERRNKLVKTKDDAPYPFNSAAELMAHCQHQSLSIAAVILANEKTSCDEKTIFKRLMHIATVMENCINKGCQADGFLAGPLNVRRRAPSLYRKLLAIGPPDAKHPQTMNWLNVYAMAVNEENAAGARVVTAPTNGAAGIIPAVLNYYKYFCKDASEKGITDFLLTAGAIGILYKKSASISGAEMGCQGEVGVACSMAAAGLAAALGGTIFQVENAAEIGMEHNLGLTCDPVAGLVQIPCIERNAMGSVKAVNAARLALAEDGEHKISLDMVINTMREIGHNMSTIYKETSKGGLAVAVNITEC